MRLKSELAYMYSTPDLHLKSINRIKKQLIVKDELKDVLVKIFALINALNLHFTFYEGVGQFSIMQHH